MPARAPSAARRRLLACGTAMAMACMRAGADLAPPSAAADAAAILDLAVDGTVYAAGPSSASAIALPAGTDHFRIRFAVAPTCPGPEAPTRLAFRLDGVDGGWRDAGTQRGASYTNMAPGEYLFRLRTLNPDGSGTATEARLPVRIAALPMQTLWFKLACVLALLLAAWLLYRCRVRTLAARVAGRLEVRTAARERQARTLQDTFLQTVQGLVLRVDAVAATLPPGDRARHQLEHVLDDASHAIGEGRDRLQELRAGDAQVLEDVLADAVARVRSSHAWISVELRVDGARRSMCPGAALEIAEIAREALRNAFVHSGAGQICVDLAYGRRTLTLRVADSGRGLDEALLRDGHRAGHWGLIGMRERAARIGGQLLVESAPGQGTRVTLTVPAGRAYADA
jgi:signal transduction histidine kinase